MSHGGVISASVAPAISSAVGGCRTEALAAGRAQRPTAHSAAPTEAHHNMNTVATTDVLGPVVADSPAAGVRRDGAVNTVPLIDQQLQARGASSPPQLLVQVLVESAFGQKATLPVSGCDTIRELKMRLANKSWFTSKHCLFFGGKELLDHDMVADIVDQVNTAANPNYLHVFVRAKDVRYGNIFTSEASTSFGNLRALDGAETADAHSPPNDSFTPRAPAQSSDDLALATVSSADAADLAPVLHIVIRKSSHVTWSSASRSGEFELTVRVTDTANHVKQQLLPSSSDTCSPALHSDINLFHNGVRLQADRPLLTYGLSDGDVLDIVPWEPPVRSAIPAAVAASTIELHQPALSSPTHALYLTWQKAADGLRAGIVPELAPSGSGGSYFLRGPDHTVVAVFKPMDEEPNMRNNPRSLTGSPSPPSVASPPYGSAPPCVRRGVLPGEGAQREIAAYLLDHGHRAGVPATAPVFLTYPDGSTKHGSLQQFVHADCDCEEMGYSAFSVYEVHKIAVLDLRLCNADRNGSNILARRADGEWRLTPIDHGFCMPDTWTDMAFVWSSWRQAKVPFDRETLEYIMALDAASDLAALAESGVRVRPACARIFKAATMVLKKVAARGLSPGDAADILERNTLRKSTMEKMHRVACEKAVREEDDEELDKNASKVLTKSQRSLSSAMIPKSDAIYLKHLDELLEEYLDDLHDDAIEFP